MRSKNVFKQNNKTNNVIIIHLNINSIRNKF